MYYLRVTEFQCKYNNGQMDKLNNLKYHLQSINCLADFLASDKSFEKNDFELLKLHVGELGKLIDSMCSERFEVTPNEVDDIIQNEEFTDDKDVEPTDVKDNMPFGDRILHDRLFTIRESIDINDKFMFVKNLFDNDLAAYNDTLDKIDKILSYNDMMIFIQLLINRYNWDTQSEVYRKFYDLTTRRFA